MSSHLCYKSENVYFLGVECHESKTRSGVEKPNKICTFAVELWAKINKK